jgi:pyrimidine-nucleoside phosphorylase
VAGTVPDYQMSALLMASYFNGLADEELGALTDAMLQSGARLEFGPDVPPRVDKHSTGGVGDKVSLVLAPLVASVGLAVPMMSGRGLGHTGGTLDKLEAIPGFRTNVPLEEAKRQVERIGCAMIGQTEQIAPADRKLYALRDATATVESIPLIAASIMSKKLAEGLNGLALDIKTGSGAFMKTLDEAQALAETMIRLGRERGCPTVALLTAMDRPLGWVCGNGLETAEAIEVLRGAGPDDVRDLVVALGVEMLVLGGLEADRDRAMSLLLGAIESGAALEKFREVIEAQGGDVRVLDDVSLLPQAPIVTSVTSSARGYVAGIPPRPIGRAIHELGGGRAKIDDTIDPAVGIVLRVRPGDRVEIGQPIADIHAADERGASTIQELLGAVIHVVPEAPSPVQPLISHRITDAGVTSLAG